MTAKAISEKIEGEGGKKKAKKYKAIRKHSDKIEDYQVGKLNSHEMNDVRTDGARPNKADEDFKKLVSNTNVWPNGPKKSPNTNERRYKWGPSGPGRNS